MHTLKANICPHAKDACFVPLTPQGTALQAGETCQCKQQRAASAQSGSACRAHGSAPFHPLVKGDRE
eukprot:scaffold236283_cov15-Tisochrysis_lutea.AAC.3